MLLLQVKAAYLIEIIFNIATEIKLWAKWAKV